MAASASEVFTCPETLLAIAPRRLDRLLQRFRNAWTPAARLLDPAQEDCRIDRLIAALCDIRCPPPSELVSALHMIRELGVPHEQDALLDAVRERGWEINLAELESPTDLAAAIWLCDPLVLERQHARRYIDRPRSFEYFQAEADQGTSIAVNEERLAALEDELEQAFEARGQGRGAKILHFPDQVGNRFVVRHGTTKRRKSCITESGLGCVSYRPARFDLVIYVARHNEIAVHARSVWEKELYCGAFGRHLFDDPKRFLFATKYTLEPLRKNPVSALECRDVAGLEAVTWCEAHYTPCISAGEIIVHRAPDLLRASTLTAHDLPADVRMVQASFQLYFRGNKTPRRVTIRPANIAYYPRDSDTSQVEAWLRKRGFINQEASDVSPNSAGILESA